MPSHAPTRIVSLQPSATVILAALGELDRIVACTKYCRDVCPQISATRPTILADSWTAQADPIIAARPDLVIAAVPYQEKAVTEILRAGARFLGLAPKTLQDIYTDIAIIAGTVGASARGESVIAEMQAEIEAVRRQAPTIPRPRVFCEEWGKPLIASQRWVAELVEAAGGTFLAEPGQQQDPEKIRSADPEIFIAAWCGAGDRVPLEKIIRDRGWQETSAARHHHVFCIRDEYLNTPAPTLVQGLRCLAAAIHPERFPQPDGLRSITSVSQSKREPVVP
jgi:iron complex transport system substrate-binding protein